VQRFDVERFNLKSLNDVELKVKYQVKISNRFTALENLDGDVDIKRVQEITVKNIKVPA
jgi:hypothetical protein